MLRSFDYAAGAAEREQAGVRVPESWVDDCADAFLAGYARSYPRHHRPPLALFVALWLDKALYEVVYELRNRPGLAGHSGKCLTSSPQQYRLRRTSRSRSGR